MSGDGQATAPAVSEGPEVIEGVESDAELLAAGWRRRFLADPARVQESVDLYTESGYEVYVQRLRPEMFHMDKCGECPATMCQSHVLLYTRRMD